MTPLKLIALDHDDLQIISAHLQDAVVKVGEMTYLPRQKRFAMIVNRFDWQHAITAGEQKKTSDRRLRTALRFERVLAAKVQGIDLKAKASVLSLLAIGFEVGPVPPAGAVTLVFAGGGAIRLDIECIEAELSDLGAAWRTKRRPQHNDSGE